MIVTIEQPAPIGTTDQLRVHRQDTALRNGHAVHVSTGNEWPHAVFMAWLDQLKEALDIPSDMQLATRAGMASPSVISGWRRGRTQPSRGNLRKLAKLAGVSPVDVFRRAGLVDDADLDDPPAMSDEVLPRQMLELIDLWRTSDADARMVILGQVEFLVNAMARR